MEKVISHLYAFYKNHVPQQVRTYVNEAYILFLKLTFPLKQGRRGFLSRQSFKKRLLIKKPEHPVADYQGIINAITLPVSGNPSASIVICVYNKLNYTLNCLYSIATCANDTPFEIILIDDCSTDETGKVLPAVKGVKYIRNQTNLGFLHSSNLGADKAAGNFLVFLNNDTFVCDHWLDNLIIFLKSSEEAGLAGSKLIYPDFTLQEAGGLVFSNGDAMNFGRGDRPFLMQYNYSRETDYCSGASIAIAKDLFSSLGGFSEKYAPCYYEDTDLAFKVRQAGFKTYYVPGSCVVHFEGVSCGRDIESGLKRYQEINRGKFLKTWENALHSHPLKKDLPFSNWAIPHFRRKKILVIDHMVPMPDKDSGSHRISLILKMLAKNYHVTFWPVNFGSDSRYIQQLNTIGIEVLDWAIPKYFLRRYGSCFDYVVICRANVLAGHLTSIKKHCCNAKIIFDTVDLHYMRISRQIPFAKNAAEKRMLEKLKEEYFKVELNGIQNTDQTWVVTQTEKEIIQAHAKAAQVQVIPNIHPFPEIEGKTYESTRDVLFIGSFAHAPNVDSVLYCAREIWPSTLSRIPGARLIVIGPYAPKEVLDLASEDVVIKGYVPDLEPELLKARVFIAPLRYGAGMKGKVGQALSYGIPTVTSTIGAEGFGFTGTELAVEDDPGRFSDRIVEIYNDKAMWEKYRDNGRAFINQFTPPEIERQLFSALCELQGEPPMQRKKAMGQ